MTINKKIFVAITTTVITVIVLWFFYIRFFQENDETRLMRQGNALIEKVELYKKKYHKLPVYLSDLGLNVPDDYPLCYTSRDGLNYIIWFGTGLGESKAYHSDSKKWENIDR